jgi:nucleoside-diphosphate-sugar epimerase
MNSRRVLVTGANGFVGRACCAEAVARGMAVRGVTRSVCDLPKGAENFVIGDIDGNTDWRDALMGCQSVIHLAARVHVMADKAADSLNEFRRVNVQGTMNLARQAAAAGAFRFVFVSSIGVNGAETFQQPFAAQDSVMPHSPYARSKCEAEQGLRRLSTETGIEVVIIRPPLVYGLHAPGNFGTLVKWLARDFPLPFGAIHNRRSFVALDNLIDLIIICLVHPAAVGQIFLVSDGEDISTTELLLRLGQAMGHPARLLPVPMSWIKFAAALAGRRDLALRLCSSLQVDIEHTRRTLGWNPPVSLEQGLIRAIQVK